MDTIESEDKSAVKQPDRVATSKVERLMDESREYLAVTQQSSNEAANNAAEAAHYASRAHDSNLLTLYLVALFGAGFAIAFVLAVLILILLAMTHVIVL